MSGPYREREFESLRGKAGGIVFNPYNRRGRFDFKTISMFVSGGVFKIGQHLLKAHEHGNRNMLAYLKYVPLFENARSGPSAPVEGPTERFAHDPYPGYWLTNALVQGLGTSLAA